MKNQKNERRDDKTMRETGIKKPTHRENSSLKSSEERNKTKERRTSDDAEDESVGK